LSRLNQSSDCAKCSSASVTLSSSSARTNHLFAPRSGGFLTVVLPVLIVARLSSSKRISWVREPQGRRLDCGHHMAEEAPEELLRELIKLLTVN
jgi:hypothetical protein